MIKLFSARENIDKERFIYESIQGEAIVIVPDQYTLIAEEQAIKYLNKKCLFDVEVMSMSRLGERVLREQGLENARILDKNGRFMLLSKIINAHKNDFKIFAKSAGKTSFTEMLSDFISAFKQQDCTIAEIESMLDDSESEELLRAKLIELKAVIEDYEKSLNGNYLDAEDYITRYTEAISKCESLHNTEIWVYGYDTFTPKFVRAILELDKVAKSINIMLNVSDFHLEETSIRQISSKAKVELYELGDLACGSSDSAEASQPEGSVNPSSHAEHLRASQGVCERKQCQTETIEYIEQGLFADDISYEDFVPSDLKIVKAANPYYEAESAANYIYSLLRDEKYRMRDIQIIANDEDTMQSIISRVFEEYGLPVFADKSRKITDSAAVAFIMNLLWFIRYTKIDSLISMLKTGLTDIEYSDIEELENYVHNYRIKGKMIYSPFKYHADRMSDETFAKIEQLREEVIAPIIKLEKLKKLSTAADFVDAFKEYLYEEWRLADRVQALADEQIEKNLFEEAQRSLQSFEKAIDLLNQLKEIMGDDEFIIDEFIQVYLAGLSSVEIGVIPPTIDGLSMGTMIRTRPRPVKAVVVLGANEGTLPMQAGTEGLFSVDEKAYFDKKGFALGKLDDIKNAEENVAMYRMLSKPSEKLYISYSMTDADGGENIASPLIDSLIDLFPRIKKDGLIEKDIISAGWNKERISQPDTSMRHLINHLKDGNTEKIDDLSNAVITWFEKNRSDEIASMLELAQDENDLHPIGSKLAKSLFAKEDGRLIVSASSLENYFECPFKYYIDRGLRPEEERKFESDPRSIGDIYHDCLRRIAEQIVVDKDYGKKLANCSNDELEKIISDTLDKIATDYNGGLFFSSENEKYRMDRIREICAAAVRAMAEQLSAKTLISAKFETKFKPIEIEVNSEKIYIEGKIDRADYIEGNRVRIVDYKTGDDKLNLEKMSHGYKMQLMIYLMASSSSEYEPAGMFYFNIKDPIVGYNNVNENIKEVPCEYKLKGKYIDEPGVLESMPENVLASGRERSISREIYDGLKDTVTKRIMEIADGITSGKIEVKPLKNDKKLVCTYCQYKAICKRDRTYAKNSGREI